MEDRMDEENKSVARPKKKQRRRTVYHNCLARPVVVEGKTLEPGQEIKLFPEQVKLYGGCLKSG